MGMVLRSHLPLYLMWDVAYVVGFPLVVVHSAGMAMPAARCVCVRTATLAPHSGAHSPRVLVARACGWVGGWRGELSESVVRCFLHPELKA